MSRYITSVVCFFIFIVLMTSLHVTGQAHDVAQLNKRVTFIKSSVDRDISDIRFQILELKTIVEQIVVGQRNASDGSIIGGPFFDYGQGMTGVDQKEITDLKTKFTTHEHRLNTLFNTVNEIKLENTGLKIKVNQLVEKKENKEERNELINNLKAELLLQLNADFETKCGDRVNSLQKKFEETEAMMLKGYKNLKTHMSDQIHNLFQSVISDQNKLSTRMDQADAKVIKLNGEVNMLEDNESVNRNVNEVERNKLKSNLEAQLLQLNTDIQTQYNDTVNAIQKTLEETTAVKMVRYTELETQWSVQIKNLSQSVISEQNKVSARINKADVIIASLDGAVSKLEVNQLVDKKERNELIKNLTSELLQLNAGVETKCNDKVSDQMKNLSQLLISEKKKLSSRIDKAEENILKLDGEANKLDGFSRAIAEIKTKTDKCCIDCGDPTPDHGTVNTTETTYGTVVQISCNHGYVLSGTSIIKCNVDFVWSESATCIPYDCGDSTPKHGRVNTTATTYGTVLKISCNHGYILNGTSIIKCNAGSVWSESATCNPYDCGSAAPANGVVIATSGTTYRKQATLQCNPGYTLNGSSIIECNATGWNGTVSCVSYGWVQLMAYNRKTWCGAGGFYCPEGRCIRNIDLCDGNNDCGDGSDEDKCHYDCGDPTPEHGTVNTTATTHGTVVKISCNHGYLLWGPSIIKCKARWWSESVTCYPYGQQPISANGYRVKPIFGSDLKKHIQIGTRVVRGTDWTRSNWSDQDGGGPGNVTHVYSYNYVEVKWDWNMRHTCCYTNGYEGKNDLLILADEE